MQDLTDIDGKRREESRRRNSQKNWNRNASRDGQIINHETGNLLTKQEEINPC